MLRKCFALLIHAVCAEIICVPLQGGILQSLPLSFQPSCLIYWKTQKSHSESHRNWSCFALQLLVPYGVYFFIMIMMMIIMMDIA